MVKHTIPHMREIGVNFKGTVEGRDVNTGDTDVIVCDGFVGNIVLKMAEGLAKTMMNMIKREVKKRPLALLGALLSKGAFKAVKDHTNPDCYGGAPLVGVNGVAIISHGKSNDFAIYNALKTAARLVEKDFIGDIAAKMAALKPTLTRLKRNPAGGRLMADFKGKNVMITGATRGIGLAIAEAFAAAGANLAVCGTNEEALAQAAKTLETHGVKVFTQK